VQQDHPRGTAIRETLTAIRLPDGFSISLYALVPGARHMAVAQDGAVLAGTTGKHVWLVRDADRDGVADEVRTFAPGLALDVPNGPCFAPDGTLYLAERNRVLAFPDAGIDPGRPDLPAFALVPQGGLIPPDEESGSHSARVCKVGPDGRIYVSLGQPYNVPPRGKLPLYDEWGIGGIVRFKPDGTGREVFSRGIRNSVGHDFHPGTGELWFTDNQVDGMGDDVPPGEINHQTAPGQHFGFPWYGGGRVLTREYADEAPPEGTVFPAVEMVAHAADLGMLFYRGSAFPDRYHHAIFSAQHGSWDRSEPVGARVMVTFVAPDGSTRPEPFAEGWIAPDGSYVGRPVDVAELPDGSLLVSDDHAGAIYRIAWEG
jgi:glucose/arabinose dehydrogenase